MALKSAAAVAALGVCFASGAATAADELCVTCAGPPATYRCQIDPASGMTSGAADPRAQLLCITELAKIGKHDTCAVDRAAALACSGPVRVLSPAVAPGGAGPAAEAPERVAPAAAAPAQPGTAAAGTPSNAEDRNPDQASAKPAGDAPPKTVEELVKKSSIDPQAGLKQAGQTIAKSADTAGTAVSDTAKAAGEAVTGTAKNAGDAVGKAGSAVGSAAKKSWDCVTSLFSKC